jgi:hypothetical protein
MEALVRLCEAPLRRPEGRARVPVTLHPPRRHLESAADRSRCQQRHVQGQGLPTRWTCSLHDHDTPPCRVHQAVPAPRVAQGLPSYPPLRPAPDTAKAESIATGRELFSRLRTRARCRRRSRPERSYVVPPVPRLWRAHAHHRNLRGGVPTTRSANADDQDRYVMSARPACRHCSPALASCWLSAGRHTVHPAVGIARSREPTAAPRRPALHVRIEHSASLDDAHTLRLSTNPRSAATTANDNSP